MSLRYVILLFVTAFSVSCAAEDPVEDKLYKTDCVAGDDPRVTVGEGVGSAFEPLEMGDSLDLVFASQAGMEAPVVIQFKDVSLMDLTAVTVTLLVDGEPIGESMTDAMGVRCDDGAGRVETSLPIDVVSHPTVASVVQLKQREAELVTVLEGSDGDLASSSLTVVLDP